MVRFLILFLLLSVSLNSACAEQLAFMFDDPLGDADGPPVPEVIGASVVFDTQTGAFTATVTASDAQPFIPLMPDLLSVNINAYNPDAGPDADPAYFRLNLTITDWNETSKEFIWTGVNPRLTAWEEGDRVALSSIVFGAPNGSGGFGSSVGICQPGGRQCFAFDAIAFGESTFVTAVPEPFCPFFLLVLLIFHTYRCR